MNFSIYEVGELVIAAIIIGMFIERQIKKPYIASLEKSHRLLKQYLYGHKS